MSFSWEEWVLLAVIFVTNIIQAITGFAGTALAMPLSIRLIGVNESKAVLDLVAIVICVYVVFTSWKSIRWKEFLLMILFVGIGFGLGFAIELLPIPQALLLKIYGGIIMALALVFFFVDFSKVRIPLPVQFLILILGGILHCLYVSGGPLVVIYASYRFKDKNQFRATLSLMWIILNSIISVQYGVEGFYTPKVWLLIGLGSIISLLSAYLGHLIAGKLPMKVFMKITYVLLFASGLLLII